MQTVGVAVEGMAHRLTGNAVPILQQLHSALQRATNKLQKYKRRNKVEIAYYAHSEAVRSCQRRACRTCRACMPRGSFPHRRQPWS